MAYQNIDSLVHEKLVDEDGRMTAAWSNFFSQFIQKTQASIGNAANEGLVPPPLTSAQQSVVQTGAQPGTLVYDSTNDKLIVRLASPVSMTTDYFHTITTN